MLTAQCYRRCAFAIALRMLDHYGNFGVLEAVREFGGRRVGLRCDLALG